MGHGPQPTDVPSARRAKVGTWCPKPGTVGGRCPGDGSRTEGLPQPEATTEPGRQVRDWYDPAHRGPPHRLPVHRMASPSPASLPPCPGAALVGDGPAQLSHAPPRPTSRSPSSATPRADILSFWVFFACGAASRLQQRRSSSAHQPLTVANILLLGNTSPGDFIGIHPGRKAHFTQRIKICFHVPISSQSRDHPAAQTQICATGG